MAPVEPPEPDHRQKHRGDGLIMQRLALLAVFIVAVIAVLTFSYVL
jgi:hypothetical protein